MTDEQSNSNNESNISALHDLVAGGIAGSASVIVGHPFDTIKVRLQTSSGSTSSTTAGGFKSLFSGMGAPLSTAAVVNAIIFATYGASTRVWEDIFEGGRHDSEVHGVMVIPSMIEHGDHGTHEQVKQWKKKDPHQNHMKRMSTREVILHRHDTLSPQQQSMIKAFTCGSIAGTVQALVICPMEHIKCRLQVQASSVIADAAGASKTVCTTINNHPSNVLSNNLAPNTRLFSTKTSQPRIYKGPIDCALSIIKDHGLFRGLFRGMGVTFWRETPAFGMYFATYDTVKDRVESLLEDKDDHHPIPTHAHAWAASALAGGISGAWTWAIIYVSGILTYSLSI